MGTPEPIDLDALRPALPNPSRLRFDSLAADLDEASAVAEVHAGVRLAVAAGRTLLAEAQWLAAELATTAEQVERLTSAEGGIRDAAIAYVHADEDDPELVGGGLYHDLKAAVDHWAAVTARMDAGSVPDGGDQ